MPISSPTTFTLNSVTLAFETFAGLMQFAIDAEDLRLGGKLLYLSGLDQGQCAFAIAANIAGAATLAASDNTFALREAQREGAIDFLVNSLDEALRILKNEIPKHEPVAVAVSLAPAVVEREMLERGVLPDLLPYQSSPSQEISAFLLQGTQLVQPAASQPARRLLIWSAPAEFAQNMNAFDALLAEHLDLADHLNRRWLRLAPRYLAPAARRLRSLACDAATAAKLIARLGAPLND